MFDFLKKKTAKESTTDKKEETQEQGKTGFFSTDFEKPKNLRRAVQNVIRNTFRDDVTKHLSSGITQDSIDSLKQTRQYSFGGMPIGALTWYGSQNFIGYQACAMIAQNWLVGKACFIPAKDAIRKGWEVTVNDGTEVDSDVFDQIRVTDQKFKLNENLVEFVNMGRVFGIRIAMFKVESTDPEYYQKPFNIDGITPGSYKGISQIDPYWIAPELNESAASDPTAIDFYEPTYWNIGSQKVHKSHLVIMRGQEVADVLKPTYLYGGVSVPQKIYERVYASERTANEAPQLAQTKRTNILKTDSAAALANQETFEEALEQYTHYKDNYGIKVIDKDSEDMTQFDTSLADLDAVIMTQYQLVAAIANVPATKLLGTTPKGFNSTGEYEEASYREELESIQAFDIKPLIERHHQLIIKSEICPKNKIDYFETETVFNPLDSLTETEQATVNLNKAQSDQIYQQTGAIDGEDIRERLINDPKSGYNGMTMPDYEDDDDGEEYEEAFNEE